MTTPETQCDKKCVLAVDDAAIVLSRIADALGKYYDVVTVNSGMRALKYLSKKRPDLVLLDIRMPDIDGFEVLQIIHAMKDRADIPVIMLTGMEDKRYVMKGFELGISDYILKPFATEDLLERVQRVLEPDKCDNNSADNLDNSDNSDASENSDNPENSDNSNNSANNLDKSDNS